MWTRLAIPALLALSLLGCGKDDPSGNEADDDNDDIPLLGEDDPNPDETGDPGETAGPGADTLLGTWALLTVNGSPLEHDGESDGICTWTYGYDLSLVFTGQDDDLFSGEMVLAYVVEVTGEDCSDAGEIDGETDTYGLQGQRQDSGRYLVEAWDTGLSMDCEIDEDANQLICQSYEGSEIVWQR